MRHTLVGNRLQLLQWLYHLKRVMGERDLTLLARNVREPHVFSDNRNKHLISKNGSNLQRRIFPVSSTFNLIPIAWPQDNTVG
jgi:hypothetical protein